MHSFMIIHPAFSPEQSKYPPKPISYPHHGYLLHPPSKHRIISFPYRFIVPNRTIEHYNHTCLAYRYPVFIKQVLSQPPQLGWLQSFFLRTSCSICLSRVRSAMICFNLKFSSSSCLSLLSSGTPRPPYFFFQLKNVASLIPIFRQTSSTFTPVSACFNAKMICDSVNFDRFICKLLI